MRRITYLLLSLIIVFASCPVAFASDYPKQTFHDLSPEHWAYSEIMDLTSRGIITGFPNNTFRPEEPVTREQFASLLARILGTSDETADVFSDVPRNRWSNAAVAAAVRRGIILPHEYGDLLGAEVAISREDAAIWIVRALDIGDTGYVEGTNDNESITRARSRAIATAAGIGLLIDMADDLQAPTTRAHAAVFISRMLELLMHTVTITADGVTEQTLYIPFGHRLSNYLPSTPVRDGYRFEGWNLNDDIMINDSILVEQDMVLTARWYKLYSDITITGDGIVTETLSTPNGDDMLSYLPSPLRKGYTFAGWYIDAGKKVDENTLINQDITLVARWDKIDVNMIPSIIFFILSAGIFFGGIIFGKKYFTNSSEMSARICAGIAAVFALVFSLAGWVFLKAYIIPIEIMSSEPARDIIGSYSFAKSIELFALVGGLIAPFVLNLLLAAALPLFFVSPASRFGKEKQYLIHLIISSAGLVWPALLWIIHGAGITMLWLLGYSLIVYPVGFFLSAWIFKQGNSQTCSKFFFDF